MFDRDQKWQSPLMGWTASQDAVSSLVLNFPSKEEAVAFAERNGAFIFLSLTVGYLANVSFFAFPGLHYTVKEDTQKQTEVKAKSYADNFKFKPPKKDDLF